MKIGFGGGSFFGWIALIIALTKEDLNQHQVLTQAPKPSVSQLIQKGPQTDDEYLIIKQGGWQCKKCGKFLHSYMGTCSCGQTRILNNDTPVSNDENSNEITQSVVDELKKFKELLDSGIITQEEFDAKKKQLLGL